MRIYKFLLVYIFGTLISCSEIKEPSLKNFVIQDDVFKSGISLIDLPYGLHDLEDTSLDQSTLIVGVHGSNSRGYEWVYPLLTLDEETNLVSFFRWDDNNCHGSSSSFLLETIKRKLVESPKIQKVVIYGHSYGGILVVSLLEEWNLQIPLLANAIAAPLKGMGQLSEACDYKPLASVKTGTRLHQWRTIKNLDGAFKDLDYDPQNAEIMGSQVTRLPKTYKGKKLGHNWSISWVADEISNTK